MVYWPMDDLLPGNDTWLICFRNLFDRNVYNNDGSPFSLSQLTNGMNTDAILVDGCCFIEIFFVADFIFSMHFVRFSSLHKDSTVSKPGESLNFRLTFNNIVRDVNIIRLFCFNGQCMNLVYVAFDYYYSFKTFKLDQTKCLSVFSWYTFTIKINFVLSAVTRWWQLFLRFSFHSISIVSWRFTVSKR